MEGKLVGFVHHLPAVRDNEVFGYSHMMAVAAEYQNQGVGAKPEMGATRARFIRRPGLYQMDFRADPRSQRAFQSESARSCGSFVRSEFLRNGLRNESRLSARPASLAWTAIVCLPVWELNRRGSKPWLMVVNIRQATPDEVIEIPNDFAALLKSDPPAAKAESLRIREEFLRAFAPDWFVAHSNVMKSDRSICLYREE